MKGRSRGIQAWPDLLGKKRKEIAKLKKSLAATRELLKKHEFCLPEGGCPECTVTILEHYTHHLDCAWDAALKDVGGELPTEFGEGESDDSKPEI